MQVKGAGEWRGQPHPEVPGPDANVLGPWRFSITRRGSEAGQAPQGSLVPKYLNGLKWHSESPLWFRTFGIPSEIPILKNAYKQSLRDTAFEVCGKPVLH